MLLLMITQVKNKLEAGSSRSTDSLPSQESLIVENERLRQELAKVKVDSKLSTEQYSLLFQNMPLGA